MIKKNSYSPEQTKMITNYDQLIKLWATAKIFPRDMSRTQKQVIKNFCKKDINWQYLTGSK
jgi:hypothetical protein